MTASARPTGFPGYSETLPCSETSVSTARRLVRTALATWGLDHLDDDGTLIMSELVTNAVRHSGSPACRAIVTRPAPDRVRLAVTDRSRTMPDLMDAPPDAVGGRGLALVDSIADRWGSDRMHWGKRVWAELRTSKPEGDCMEPEVRAPEAGERGIAHP
ncbi:ATP-binding protein [Streptomyces sp. CA-251387]|uniref:ATP-binding protein n=1 Tax=Streptomyces sp. CA-251387 TaxID=3240064 RepID=UPI003D925008